MALMAVGTTFQVGGPFLPEGWLAVAVDPTLAAAAGVLIGASFAVIVSRLLGPTVRRLRRAARRGKRAGYRLLGLLTGRSSPVGGLPERLAEAERALAVLQAEHDGLRSVLAQRASRITALEHALSAVEARAQRETAALEAQLAVEKTAHADLEAEAVRLKIELVEVQCRAAEVPLLRDELDRLRPPGPKRSIG